MSTTIPGSLPKTPTPTEAPTTNPSIQDLPPEIQEHICSFISVRERRDINSLAMTDKGFEQNMRGHQDAAKPVRNIDPVLLKSRNAFEDQAEVAVDVRALLDELFEKFDALPSLRLQLFEEILRFANGIKDHKLAAICCGRLWDAIPRLSGPDRALAIRELFFSPATRNSGENPLPQLEIAFQHIAADSDKPQFIGLLSFQLAECSDSDFPAVQSALFNKIDKLPLREQCDALLALHANLIANAWDVYHPGKEIETDEKKYQQFFQAVYERIGKLPLPERIRVIGAWTSPRAWNGDHRNRDEMSINLLRLIPSSTPATPETALAIVQQIQSRFQKDAELDSLARLRNVLNGIAHLPPILQAFVLALWIHSEGDAHLCGDLKWQAISEACEGLPELERAELLVLLANRIGMVSNAFHCRWEDDDWNPGKSAQELASNIERRRRDAADVHLEKYPYASPDDYGSTCFPATAALSTLARLTKTLAPLQRITVLETLLSEETEYHMELRQMSLEERDDCANQLRTLIASLPDPQARQSLNQRLDTVLADAE